MSMVDGWWGVVTSQDLTATGLGWPQFVDDETLALGWPGRGDVSRETDTDSDVAMTTDATDQSAPLTGDDAWARSGSTAVSRAGIDISTGPAVPEPTPATDNRPDSTKAPVREQPARKEDEGASAYVSAALAAPSARRIKFDADEVPERDTPDDVQHPVSRETALPRPPRPRVMVVANQKGGVGKTTSAVNIATGLAIGGLNVVVIDLDPQGNASTALGVDHHEGVPGTYEVLLEGATIAEHLADSPEASTLKVLPATISLAGAEIQLVSAVARETRLRKAINSYLAESDVDYVILDCPPSLGLLTLNALVAAQEIMIPIQCEYYALEGVSQLMNTINLVKGELNDDLQLSTVVLTMYDARTRLSSQVANEVQEHFPAQTLATTIPRSVRISEAPSYGQSVIRYHLASAGAEAYLKVAEEIARRGSEATQ